MHHSCVYRALRRVPPAFQNRECVGGLVRICKRPCDRNHLHPAVHHVQNWLAEHAIEPVALADLAQVANMSVRSFSRAFKDATGLTSVQYQQRLRLEVAATLVNNSELSLARERCPLWF